jgi:ComF family protein
MFHRLLEDLMHLIAPALCPACGVVLAADEGAVCGACRSSLEPAPFPRDLYLDLIGFFPPEEIALDAVGALFSFRRGGPVQNLIHALKYHGASRLGTELGHELGRGLALFREFEQVDLVVPIPLHAARRRERGFNQAEAIGRGIASALGIAIEPRAVTRRSNTRSQTRLDAEERVSNMTAVFRAVGGAVAGANVLLCDDVLTTGATLNACADALLCAGARSVVGGCLARDQVDSRTVEPIPAMLLG